MGYFGLTGGVASGKSTVARMFEELGAKVIDADRIGHELLGSTQPPYNEIVRRFGKEVLDASGEIDRRRLGAVVFSDAAKLRELNAILHPRIIERVEKEAQRYRAQDPRAVILVDAALIFEAGIGSRFEKLLVAWCPPEMQIERLMAKRGLSRKKAEQRVASQIPSDEKRRRADYVIDCSGSPEDTRKQVERLFLELRRIVAGN